MGNMEIIESDILDLNIDLISMKNKSILITGASGVIGIYLLSYIKKKQKELNITIYTWHKNNVSLFDELFNDCNKIIGDITDLNNFKDLPKFDYIIHSAGYAQPGKFLLDKVKTIELNTISTINLIERLKDDGSFLFVSSSEVYNGLEKANITETEIGTTNTNNHRSCYIEGKRCGESICHAYREMGKNIKIARLSLAYGPGNQKNDSRVLYSLINKAITDDNIELIDSGSAIRTCLYVTDVLEMFLNILLRGKNHTYNVGGISVITILDLAKKIGDSFNKEVIIPAISHELVGNSKIVNISIDRYINEFGKKSFVSIDKGLEKTIEWQIKLHERD